MVAGGVRIGWLDLPGHVRAGMEDVLGSTVIEAVSQPGGFSPGTADRVVLADGRRAFVKVVGTILNPRSPDIHRAEIRVMGVLPDDLPVPRLLGHYDDGDWVGLVLSDVDGRHPAEPWRSDELAAVLETLTTMSTRLTPCPVPEVATVWELESESFTAWPRLAAAPPDDLDPWARRHLDRLVDAAAPARAALDGDTLVHLDMRADNILLSDTGVVVVDWPWACRGAAWTDLALFLCSVATIGGADPEQVARSHPLLLGVDPDALTAVVVALAGFWVEACRAPESPGLPTVRDFQRRSGVATLRWLERRTGWP